VEAVDLDRHPIDRCRRETPVSQRARQAGRWWKWRPADGPARGRRASRSRTQHPLRSGRGPVELAVDRGHHALDLSRARRCGTSTPTSSSTSTSSPARVEVVADARAFLRVDALALEEHALGVEARRDVEALSGVRVLAIRRSDSPSLGAAQCRAIAPASPCRPSRGCASGRRRAAAGEQVVRPRAKDLGGLGAPPGSGRGRRDGGPAAGVRSRCTAAWSAPSPRSRELGDHGLSHGGASRSAAWRAAPVVSMAA